jgi:hypothetical protein
MHSLKLSAYWLSSQLIECQCVTYSIDTSGIKLVVWGGVPTGLSNSFLYLKKIILRHSEQKITAVYADPDSKMLWIRIKRGRNRKLRNKFKFFLLLGSGLK